ncbi:ABC transporter substrate-binding protein|uniref:Amino acid/amide ABC transporter substrate-binding protein, HAAT family n=1 Tax=Dendrosporobacter quercicolus TaxID=146817 RepID=A0A1G9M936_9FIRM|nr:ABC transporter substrate-binding protein [Dendrosporobacter quercicolus]NSL46964.1 ABC transporter substrate-binding protein [Dendrosporobacter quercicolus DSM 1736]SDL70739.1 amino acid/amide ABC transporter substrate-binding protein, HAAT family [Dendrosporobacter quercicolus]
MKQKRIKLFSLLAGFSLIAGLVAGCGSSSSSSSSDAIKIGVVYELTGNTASFGTAAANGTKLALKEINAKGGVLGKQIQPVVVDNKGEPSESTNAVTKVITQDKVSAIVGFTVSSCGIAGSTVADVNKIPLVAAATTNPKVTLDEASGKAKEYVFRACFIDPFQGTVASNFAMNSLKLTKAVVLIDNSSDYSKGLAQFFKDGYTKQGGQILAEEAYLQKDQDFKAILTKIKALNPELIYLPGYYEEVGKIIKQAREMGITAAFLGGDGWDSPKLVEIGGAQALNNAYHVNFYSIEDANPTSKAFVEAYQKEYGQAPDAMAAMGYDAAYLLVDAIQRANSLEAAKIQAALASTQTFKSLSGDMSLNASHDAIRSAVIMELKDGKQIYRETVKP